MNRRKEFFGKRGRVTELVLMGTAGIVIVFTILLIHYDLTTQSWIRLRTVVSLAVLSYVVIAYILLIKQKFLVASWLLVILYQAIAALTLLYWGLNTPVGIIATCFSVVLPSILLGSKSVLPTTLVTMVLLFAIQSVHTSGIFSPAIDEIKVSASFIDGVIYAVVFGAFALISWIASRQVEAMLTRARSAEQKLRAQNNLLEAELENESAILRKERFNRVQQLHRFAILGQSTTALLHDLSNRLSILTLDIDDLKEQHKNSASLMSTEQAISEINQLMRSSKEQLRLTEENEFFKPFETVHACVDDLHSRFQKHSIKFKLELRSPFQKIELRGSEFSLMHAVEILLNNAVEACLTTHQKQVTLRTQVTADSLEIMIVDSGSGISDAARKKLFQAGPSLKTTGLGIGLYLARELIRNNFNGDVVLRHSSPKGSTFTISVPLGANI